MSTLSAQPVVVNEEARIALSEAAAGAERRNRPRIFLVLGVAAIAAAVIYAATGVSARAGAGSELSMEQELTAQVKEAVESLLALRADESVQITSERYAPNLLVTAKLEQAAAASGLTGVNISDNEDPRSAPPGMQRKRYTVNLTNVDAEPLLRWMTKALSEIQGLEVASIQISPGTGTPEGKPRWTGQVVFTRWERRS